MIAFYFLIAILTTTLGALTGMGGGVIIKPVLDLMGHYDAQTISILSSISVFSMAIVSVIKQFLAKPKINLKVVIPLAIGAVVGGIIGQNTLDFAIKTSPSPSIIVVLQNVILAILIIIVFYYMLNKNKIKSKNLNGMLISCIVGIFLGIVSSFLGIGGGPINVAIFMYLFSYDTKTSALSSLVAILFSQISKLSLLMLTTGFSEYDLSVLPFMIVGAITGGFIGSKLTSKFTTNQIDTAFNGVQILVFAFCIINIVKQFS